MMRVERGMSVRVAVGYCLNEILSAYILQEIIDLLRTVDCRG